MIIKSNRQEPREYDLQGHLALSISLFVGLGIAYGTGWVTGWGHMHTSQSLWGGALGLAIFLGWVVDNHIGMRLREHEAEREAAAIDAEEADEHEARDAA